ncbi:NAD(P)-binding protein [Hyphopichia burtonii NRRL Y-1933]|uniref:NAD(P)-binding protein n=1 Tax=Hyphopichia burtonii NRRL Y-1933 TaxID=984485 RepID=A0A1E4RMP7_9ASCO|nr:NAD(P)-binding protein [Hyphopichia burtonii NRRL Y-1933]ODV68516.1 NAD(P)-binding protein [Hyphopichia burtonii NRRL Y-1933]
MTVTYFITGANRGIGFQLAKQISADSNNVVIATTRSFANSAALQDLNRPNLHIIEYDVASPLEKMKQDLVPIEEYAPNGVDVVIQNAGIATANQKSILETTEDDLAKHFAVNTIGSVKVYQSIFPYWSKKVNPETVKKFIFISSSVSWVNNFFPMLSSHYGPSKAALNLVVRHIAFDHKSAELDHIKNSIIVPVHPGLVTTDMSKEALGDYNFDESPIPVLKPEESAGCIIKIIDNLEPKDNDTFISYDGTRVSW